MPNPLALIFFIEACYCVSTGVLNEITDRYIFERMEGYVTKCYT